MAMNVSRKRALSASPIQPSNVQPKRSRIEGHYVRRDKRGCLQLVFEAISSQSESSSGAPIEHGSDGISQSFQRLLSSRCSLRSICPATHTKNGDEDLGLVRSHSMEPSTDRDCWSWCKSPSSFCRTSKSAEPTYGYQTPLNRSELAYGNIASPSLTHFTFSPTDSVHSEIEYDPTPRISPPRPDFSYDILPGFPGHSDRRWSPTSPSSPSRSESVYDGFSHTNLPTSSGRSKTEDRILSPTSPARSIFQSDHVDVNRWETADDQTSCSRSKSTASTESSSHQPASPDNGSGSSLSTSLRSERLLHSTSSPTSSRLSTHTRSTTVSPTSRPSHRSFLSDSDATSTSGSTTSSTASPESPGVPESEFSGFPSSNSSSCGGPRSPLTAQNLGSLQSRLASFLPTLHAANQTLELERAAGKLADRDIENVEGDAYIEMVRLRLVCLDQRWDGRFWREGSGTDSRNQDLGLGVLEEKKQRSGILLQDDDTASETSSRSSSLVLAPATTPKKASPLDPQPVSPGKEFMARLLGRQTKAGAKPVIQVLE